MTNSNIFNLNFRDLISAVLSGILVAIFSYIASLTDIFSADPKQILSIAVMAAVTSLAKAFATTQEGKFLGGVKIK